MLSCCQCLGLGQELGLVPGGLPHPPLAGDQPPRLLHAQPPGGQTLLHHRRVQRVSEQEGNLNRDQAVNGY